MDRSGPAAWMLLATLVLPALVGLIEAWRRGRGVFGWIVNGIVAMAGGVVGMLLAVNLGGVPFSECAAMSNARAGVLLFGGLGVGALIALWLVNRFRG